MFVLECGYVGNIYIIIEERFNIDSLLDYVIGEGFFFNVGVMGFIFIFFLLLFFDYYLFLVLYQNVCWVDLNGDGIFELIIGSQEIMAYQFNFFIQ